MVKLTYDKEADAVYVYLIEKIKNGEVAKTYPCDPDEVNGEINLDFDSQNRLIGIEILNVSQKLRPETLKDIPS